VSRRSNAHRRGPSPPGPWGHLCRNSRSLPARRQSGSCVARPPAPSLTPTDRSPRSTPIRSPLWPTILTSWSRPTVSIRW